MARTNIGGVWRQHAAVLRECTSGHMQLQLPRQPREGDTPSLEIIIEHLAHGFGQLEVLKDISLHVASGEIVAILGPSGCGKTTLLRLAGGLERPRSGTIGTRGHSPNPGRPIAHVFQDPTLLPWRTVSGNVMLPLEHTKMPNEERKRRVAEAMARVRLADFSNTYPKALSGGMRQRAGIARALVVDPAVLLMDEPFAALDEQTRELLLGDLAELWRANRFTCLYVTHSPAEAARIGHRVVVLSHRPAAIREILKIDVPLAERSESHPAIAAARSRIWALVRPTTANE